MPKVVHADVLKPGLLQAVGPCLFEVSQEEILAVFVLSVEQVGASRRYAVEIHPHFIGNRFVDWNMRFGIGNKYGPIEWVILLP